MPPLCPHDLEHAIKAYLLYFTLQFTTSLLLIRTSLVISHMSLESRLCWTTPTPTPSLTFFDRMFTAA